MGTAPAYFGDKHTGIFKDSQNLNLSNALGCCVRALLCSGSVLVKLAQYEVFFIMCGFKNVGQTGPNDAVQSLISSLTQGFDASDPVRVPTAEGWLVDLKLSQIFIGCVFLWGLSGCPY